MIREDLYYSNYRRLFEKITFFLAGLNYIILIIAIQFHWVILTEDTATRAIIFATVPLIIFLIFFSSYKNIIPQRIGDYLQVVLWVLLIAAGNSYWLGSLKIDGPLFFANILLIPFFILLMSQSLLYFLAGLTAVFFITESLLTVPSIDFLMGFTVFIKIAALLIIAFICSLLIKRTRREIKRSNEMEQMARNIEDLSRMKTEFLKVVNHQLRTPVSIIKGMSSMLNEKTLPKQKQKDYIEKLYISSERLQTILDDILVAQNLIGGPTSVDLRPCKIEGIVKRLVDHQQSMAGARGLKIIFNKPKTKIPISLLDEEVINRIVSRLIDNAVLYTNKGKIEVSLQITEERDNKFIQISVKDSGIGLDEKDKKNLFKLFYRGEKATSLHPNGSGLGLFIIKNLVESHRGTVRAESEGKRKGTTFIIRVPFRTEV